MYFYCVGICIFVFCASLQSNGRGLKLCPRIKVLHTGWCNTSPVCPALQQSASTWGCADAQCREGSTHPTCVETPLLEGSLGCSLRQRCSSTLQLRCLTSEGLRRMGTCTASLCSVYQLLADVWSFPWPRLQEWYQTVMKFGSIIFFYMWRVYSESQLMKEPESKEVLAALILSRFL